MQHHRRAPVIASIAAMADDSDKNLAHNDEAQLQRLLDSMGQESAAAPRPPKKKSSKGSAGQESAAPRPKKKKGAVSKFREQQKQKRRGSIDTGAAREPAPAPRVGGVGLDLLVLGLEGVVGGRHGWERSSWRGWASAVPGRRATSEEGGVSCFPGPKMQQSVAG